jgi:hypothetical protein
MLGLKSYVKSLLFNVFVKCQFLFLVLFLVGLYLLRILGLGRFCENRLMKLTIRLTILSSLVTSFLPNVFLNRFFIALDKKIETIFSNDGESGV